MYKQKIAKHLIELNKKDFDDTFNTMTSLLTNSGNRFFHFIDKNPLFEDNSKEAIYAYLVSSRKRRYAYKQQSDENYDIPAVCMLTDDACKK